MDVTDRKLLNIIQGRFPLVDRPYQALGEELGIDEADVIERLSVLKRQNVLRQISAIFRHPAFGLQDYVGGDGLRAGRPYTAVPW